MTQPPILPYKAPDPNKSGDLEKYMAIGLALGVGSVILGIYFGGMMRSLIPFFIPPIVALGVVLGLSIDRRGQGRVAGVLLASFFIALSIGILLTATCAALSYTS